MAWVTAHPTNPIQQTNNNAQVTTKAERKGNNVVSSAHGVPVKVTGGGVTHQQQ